MSANKPLTRKQQFWLEHIKAAEASQQSLASYAQEHSLPIKNFYNARSGIELAAGGFKLAAMKEMAADNLPNDVDALNALLLTAHKKIDSLKQRLSAVIYHYDPGRGQAVAKRLLTEYCGYLQTDAWHAYDAVHDENIIAVACWALAKSKPSPKLKQAIAFIQKRY